MTGGFKTWLARIVGVVLVGLILYTTPMIVDEAQAETTNDFIAKSAESFVKSITNDYTQYLRDSLRYNIDSVSQDIIELNKVVEKALLTAQEVDKASIAQNLAEFEKKLKQEAAPFDELAQKTEAYNNTLETSLKKTLSQLRTEVRDDFQKSEKAFTGISKAISNIADLTSKASELNLEDIASQLNNSVQGLQRAIKIAEQATQVMGG